VSSPVKPIQWETTTDRQIYSTATANDRGVPTASTDGGRLVTICLLTDLEHVAPLKVAVVIGLDLLGDALTERSLQSVLATRVQHLLFDVGTVWAPEQQTVATYTQFTHPKF